MIGQKKFILTIFICLLFLCNTVVGNNFQKIHPNQKNNYDLLIITQENFVDLLQKLADHKNSYNVKTKIVTINDVYNQMFWKGRDEPEKIKYFIKKAFDEWNIKYVLFVGDYKQIPVRYVFNSFLNNSYTPPEEYFISDLYYSDIYDENNTFSSWDSNNNGIYGEWKGENADDRIDLLPDVSIGRLLCKNRYEVKIMVKKIIDYETKTYDQDWFKKIVFVGGDTAPESWDSNWTGFEGEENMEKIILNMTDFTPITLKTSDKTFSKPGDIIKEINKGCGFFYLEGHANPFSWGAYTPNGTGWVDGLSTFNMNFLLNRGKNPICVVGGCRSLKFDISPVLKCWGWKLTSRMLGGSIATIGCTSEWMIKEDKQSKNGAGDYLNQRLFWEYGINGTTILGDVINNAITGYLDLYPINWNTPAQSDYAIDAKTLQSYILLGDPSLKIGGYK